MTSAPSVPSVPPLGDQRPRLESLPPADDWSQGEDAIELARQAGLVLDDWQRHVLRGALAMRGDRWAAFEVCLIVSRQNGKGSIIEALELAALFLFDDVRLILHSAHKFDTAADAFRRILGLIESSPDFSREVAKIVRSHGSESIELKNGKRLRFIARSAGAGRGFAADLVILDEAFNISEDAMASMLPTLSTRPNPQVWYTSTAGGPTSVQLGRVRARGLTGGDGSLAFFEWSVPDDYDPADPAAWVRANPGLGIRISPEYVALERASLTPESFATERLGIGLYPTDLADAWLVVGRDTWAALADPKSVVRDPVALAAEMTRGREAGVGDVSRRRGCGRMAGLVWKWWTGGRARTGWRPGWWRCGRSTSRARWWWTRPVTPGRWLRRSTQAGVDVAESFTARDAAHAFGLFRDLVQSGGLRHRGDDRLDKSLAGATTRPLADALAWDRRDPRVDLGPVVSVSLACWGFRRFGLGRVAPYNLLHSVG